MSWGSRRARSLGLSCKEDEVDSQEERRKKLQENFIKQSQTLVKEGEENVKPVVTTKTSKQPKRSAYEKQLEQKVKELQEKVNDQKEIIADVRKKRKSAIEELEKTTKHFSKCEAELVRVVASETDLLAKVKQLELENEKLRESNGKYRGMVESLSNKTSIQRQHIQSRDKVIRMHKSNIKDILNGEGVAGSYYGTKIKELKDEIAKLNLRLMKTNKDHDKRVAEYVTKIKELASRLKTTKEDSIDLTERRGMLTGILKQADGTLYFESLLGTKHNLEPIKGGSPCAVNIVSEDTVSLSRIYSVEEFISVSKDKTPKSASERAVKNIADSLKFAKSYRVLLIGARNKDQYMSALKRVGLNPTWYNPFEGNVVRLRGMLDRFDMVICCSSHAKHYAFYLMEHMQESDPVNAVKYSNIIDDSVANILGRINYIIENSDLKEDSNSPTYM